MKYFDNPQTLEDLKKQYRELAFKHHPDRGGYSEHSVRESERDVHSATMQEVKNEYDNLFAKLKDIHRNKDGETYTAYNPTNETLVNTCYDFVELVFT